MSSKQTYPKIKKKKKNLSIHFDISLKTTYTRHQKKKKSLIANLFQMCKI